MSLFRGEFHTFKTLMTGSRQHSQAWIRQSSLKMWKTSSTRLRLFRLHRWRLKLGTLTMKHPSRGSFGSGPAEGCCDASPPFTHFFQSQACSGLATTLRARHTGQREGQAQQWTVSILKLAHHNAIQINKQHRRAGQPPPLWLQPRWFSWTKRFTRTQCKTTLTEKYTKSQIKPGMASPQLKHIISRHGSYPADQPSPAACIARLSCTEAPSMYAWEWRWYPCCPSRRGNC